MARECGDMVPNWARTVGSFVEGLREEQRREWDERLRRVHKTTLADLEGTLHGGMTMSEYVASTHFDGYRLEDFAPDKDFTHPVDYLVPVSVHSVAVADCRALAADLRGMAKARTKDGAERYTFPYAAVIYDNGEADFGGTNFYLFVGPEKSRAYPAHRHGLPNYNLILVLSGGKHVVAWPNQETPNLYPFPEDITPTENEVAERPLGYGADAFFSSPSSSDGETEKQPDLAKVSESWEGAAGPGDLVFIPCGIPHAVQNRGEMLAVGWFSSGFDMSGTGAGEESFRLGKDHEGVYPSLKCPNKANAMDYTCKAKRHKIRRISKVEEEEEDIFYACDT